MLCRICYSKHMSAAISIVPLEQRHLAQAEAWAARSASHALLKTSAASLDPGRSFGWAALQGDTLVGLVTVTTANDGGNYLDFLIKPALQRQGIGTQLLAYALGQPSAQGLRRLRAVTESDNTAAQKLLTRMDFSRIGYADDGRLLFERH